MIQNYWFAQLYLICICKYYTLNHGIGTTIYYNNTIYELRSICETNRFGPNRIKMLVDSGSEWCDKYRFDNDVIIS